MDDIKHTLFQNLLRVPGGEIRGGACMPPPGPPGGHELAKRAGAGRVKLLLGRAKLRKRTQYCWLAQSSRKIFWHTVVGYSSHLRCKNLTFSSLVRKQIFCIEMIHKLMGM